jgi:hypothetical protein
MNRHTTYDPRETIQTQAPRSVWLLDQEENRGSSESKRDGEDKKPLEFTSETERRSTGCN